MAKSKYTKELQDEICKYILGGNNYDDSAVLAGISESTFYEWQDPTSDYYNLEFSEAVKKAAKQCKARNVALVHTAAQTTWQAAAWYLERRFRDEYAIKQINDNTGTHTTLIINLTPGNDILSATGKLNASSAGSIVQLPGTV